MIEPVVSLDEVAKHQAEQRQMLLTKPVGSLGVLEGLAVQFAAWQGEQRPMLQRVHISIFAADHGVAEEGVSAFPQIVTAEMVRNFVRGGAAISVLAQYHQAILEIIDVGVKDLPPLASVICARAGNATNNIAKKNAMTEEQLQLALQAGKQAAERAKDQSAQLFIGGEMGIANTTSTTAIVCVLLNTTDGAALTGAGTGLDKEGIQHKSRVVTSILARYNNEIAQQDISGDDALNASLKLLCIIGGFEIAAIVASFIRSAQLGIPILVDGFITTAAALVAVKINKNLKQWLLFSHCSAELGHAKILSALGAKPLIDFEMRLGEASGAATVIPLIKQALLLHNNMATFAEAEVSK
jgi:nicotinate-nucleotide--dimethylbenzimidazole phosphoribosyltransferase